MKNWSLFSFVKPLNRLVFIEDTFTSNSFLSDVMFTNTMLFTVDPRSLVIVTILPHKFPLAMPLTMFVGALVVLTVGRNELSVAMLFIMHP